LPRAGGTGDVHLTLSQQVPVDAAIMVTTPQQLALVDVDKGIRMFDKVGIPTIAIVENMSFFQCDHGTRYNIFGEGGGRRLATQFGIEGFHQLPIDPSFNGGSSPTSGPPLASKEFSSSLISTALRNIAVQVSAELKRSAAMRGKKQKAVSANGGSHLLLTGGGLPDLTLPARAVRLACKCAYCIDEWTGDSKLDPESVPLDLAALKVESAGRYAITVKWSDTHSGLYSFNHLRSLGETDCVGGASLGESPSGSVTGLNAKSA